MFIKKCLISSLITLVISVSFLTGYMTVPVYADDVSEEEYEYISSRSDMIASIQAYLNSCGLGVLTDVQGAIDEWMIGQQMELQDFAEHVEKTPVGILKYRYDTYMIGKLNEFAGYIARKYNFADFSDDGEEQNVIAYSGEQFTDYDGNKCLIYVLKSGSGTYNNYNYPLSNIVYYGTNLKYSQYDFDSITSGTDFSVHASASTTFTQRLGVVNYSGYKYVAPGGNFSYAVGTAPRAIGGISVFRVQGSNSLYISGIGVHSSDFPNNPDTYALLFPASISNANPTDPVDVTVHTPKGVQLPDPEEEPTIIVIPRSSTGNTYNYDQSQTYIDNSVTNNTTYYSFGGGGDGGDGGEGGEGGDGSGCGCPDYSPKFDTIIADLELLINEVITFRNNFDSYVQNVASAEKQLVSDIKDYMVALYNTIVQFFTNQMSAISSQLYSILTWVEQIYNKLDNAHDPSDWSIPDPEDITIPDSDLSLPLQLEQYFPFCIPWDILLIFKVMDTEPQAPRFHGPIHFAFGSHFSYTWNVDVDFSDYEDLARQVRTVEFVGFLLFLMLFTGHMFRG